LLLAFMVAFNRSRTVLLCRAWHLLEVAFIPVPVHFKPDTIKAMGCRHNEELGHGCVIYDLWLPEVAHAWQGGLNGWLHWVGSSLKARRLSLSHPL